METSDILRETVNDLIQRTAERKIRWSVINANAIRWIKQDQPDEQTTVTLQKQPSPNQIAKEVFIMTIQPVRMIPYRNAPGQPNVTRVNPVPQPAIQISTLTDPRLGDSFKQLFVQGFSEAHSQDEEKKIEALRNLLKGL
jgi:hypothetical protein